MIRNYTKDGQELKDLSGHVIKIDEAKEFYEVIASITRRLKNEKKTKR